MEAIFAEILSKFPQLMNVSSLRLKEKPLPQRIIYNTSHANTNNNLIKQIEKSCEESTIEQKRRKPRPFLLATILNFLDKFISTYVDHSPLQPSIDPTNVLSGTYAPVDELPPTACEVVEGGGPIPSCLEGAYIRNGPNPQLTPPGPYHLFDGDGMLHMIKISHGQATFSSRYVKTHKYLKEWEMGYPFFPSIFASFNGLGAAVARSVLSVTRILVGHFDPLTHGFGTANTSLAFFGGSLFALVESDLPYAIKVTSDGDILTLGRDDLQSKEPFFRMTAHPKIDRKTGEVFAFRYNIMQPFLTFFRIDPQGRKERDVHINSMKSMTIIHDFAITENYAIFPDSQIVVNPLNILTSGRAGPVGVDVRKVPRLGFIRRYAKDDSEMWWIETPGFNVLHAVNAWEEDGGNTIVLVASNPLSVGKVFESFDCAKFSLEKVIIDVKKKKVQRHVLSHKVLEFGAINKAYAAMRNRYLYAAIIGKPNRVEGIVKLDLSVSSKTEECEVGQRLYGPGCHGGEPFFVAREPNNPEATEDDGYILNYVYDEDSGETRFIVMYAKSPNLEIVAAVKIPQRIPSGFHGIFVSQCEIDDNCIL